jgi:hypothetical protein
MPDDWSCSRCKAAAAPSDLRQLWRGGLRVLKLVGMHPGEEATRLYCGRCKASLDLGIGFLAALGLIGGALLIMMWSHQWLGWPN